MSVDLGGGRVAMSEHLLNIPNINVFFKQQRSENYYLEPHSGCAWSEEERYCILVKWDDFINNPEKYINDAFEKRSSELSEKVHVNINRGNVIKRYW